MAAANEKAPAPAELDDTEQNGAPAPLPRTAGSNLTSRLGGLPKGLEARPGGLYFEHEGKDGVKEWKWLCSPLRVVARTRASDGNGWGCLVELTDADNLTKRWAIPAAMFAGDGREVRAGLLDRGLNLASGQTARNRLHDLLMQWRPEARATTTERLGWTDSTFAAFAFGDGQVLGNGNVVYQHEHAPPAAAAMRPGGTLDGWTAEVGARCAGNPLMVTAVSLALAGPLLEPLNMGSGGIHLRGPSSCGKSSILRAAVSVWGAPGFMFTWRATSNGLEGVAAACNGTVLALDELAEVDARAAGEAVYMLGNGSGKVRANKSGQARARAEWHVPIISTGEISLGDKLAEAGKRPKAGQEVRLLDIPVDGFEHGAFGCLHGALGGAAFSDATRRAAAENHGWAGLQFVAAFIENPDDMKVAVRGAVDGFMHKAEARFGARLCEGQARRGAERLAVAAAAGEVATHLGLTGWPKGEANHATLAVLKLWLEGRGGPGAAEAREAVERARAAIERHGNSRFERIRDGSGRAVINRLGWRDDEHYYFTGDGWREVHEGADAQRAAKHLAEAGFLAIDGDNRFTRKAPRDADGSRPRVYWVKASILGDGEDGGDDE